MQKTVIITYGEINKKIFLKEEGFMKTYHKPEMELELFERADVLDLSGEDTFNDGWFTDSIGGNG